MGIDTDARNILVSRPMFASDGVTGRSAAGYWGVECKSGEEVFVKDVSRTHVPKAHIEGTALKKLLGAGVRNIPELIARGDAGEVVFWFPWT